MKLSVFGANGQTGRLVVKQAVAEGHEVTAVVRRPHEYTFSAANLTVAKADAMDSDAVKRVVAGSEGVVSALGSQGYTKEEVTLYSRGMSNILDAMATHDVRRVACISTTGVTFKAPPGENLFVRFIVLPMLLRMGRTAYEDNARMEQIVRSSEVDWTIMRASGLFDSDTRTSYEIRTPPTAGHYTARIDLADALLRAVVDGRQSRKTVEVITVEGTPTIIDVLRREAFGRSQ
ncbi:NAD(P)-dependent oxidoreductase [Nocardia sp. NPDC051052]|uniref:NAD(P)-dependent oxidoreductase n=1 Tax=Nocardia sp. NPDC051052 TaxID=3364322 RepID=UPI0037A2452E